MKLNDPWFTARFDGFTPGPCSSLDEAAAVVFRCPCSFGQPKDDAWHMTRIPFANPRQGAHEPHGWQMSGTSLDDLSLSPSILTSGGPDCVECWHGFLTNGEFKACG